MDPVALTRWQAGLPADKMALAVLLDVLQGQWLTAHGALLPAMRVGGAHAVRNQILDLEHQMHYLEGQLIA